MTPAVRWWMVAVAVASRAPRGAAELGRSLLRLNELAVDNSLVGACCRFFASVAPPLHRIEVSAALPASAAAAAVAVAAVQVRELREDPAAGTHRPNTNRREVFSGHFVRVRCVHCASPGA